MCHKLKKKLENGICADKFCAFVQFLGWKFGKVQDFFLSGKSVEERRLRWLGHVQGMSDDSLTHSLVDLPQRGLATADDHSDIFLLHCARSCDVSFS